MHLTGVRLHHRSGESTRESMICLCRLSGPHKRLDCDSRDMSRSVCPLASPSGKGRILLSRISKPALPSSRTRWPSPPSQEYCSRAAVSPRRRYGAPRTAPPRPRLPLSKRQMPDTPATPSSPSPFPPSPGSGTRGRRRAHSSPTDPRNAKCAVCSRRDPVSARTREGPT